MVEYAGFWLRFGAAIIDGFCVLGISLAITLVISVPIGLMTGSGLTAAVLGYFILTLCSVMVRWIYFAKLESSPEQATWGKQALGIKVTDLKGKRISFPRATGRHFAKYLSALPYCIGYAMIAFTRKKQGLHDFIASTLVVKAKTK